MREKKPKEENREERRMKIVYASKNDLQLI